MIRHAELLTHDAGNTFTGPDLSAEAVDYRSTFQDSLQAGALVDGQLGLPATWSNLGFASRATRLPVIHRHPGYSQPKSNVGRRGTGS